MGYYVIYSTNSESGSITTGGRGSTGEETGGENGDAFLNDTKVASGVWVRGGNGGNLGQPGQPATTNGGTIIGKPGAAGAAVLYGSLGGWTSDSKGSGNSTLGQIFGSY